MFLSLGVIFVLGIIGGMIFEKIHLPKIVFYTIMGILLGPSVLGFLNEDLLNISSYLRQIALIIILTRSGLSLNIKKLKDSIERRKKLLSNENYVNKAPKNIVDFDREKLKEEEAKLKLLEEQL